MIEFMTREGPDREWSDEFKWIGWEQMDHERNETWHIVDYYGESHLSVIADTLYGPTGGNSIESGTLPGNWVMVTVPVLKSTHNTQE